MRSANQTHAEAILGVAGAKIYVEPYEKKTMLTAARPSRSVKAMQTQEQAAAERAVHAEGRQVEPEESNVYMRLSPPVIIDAPECQKPR